MHQLQDHTLCHAWLQEPYNGLYLGLKKTEKNKLNSQNTDIGTRKKSLIKNELPSSVFEASRPFHEFLYGPALIRFVSSSPSTENFGVEFNRGGCWKTDAFESVLWKVNFYWLEVMTHICLANYSLASCEPSTNDSAKTIVKAQQVGSISGHIERMNHECISLSPLQSFEFRLQSPKFVYSAKGDSSTQAQGGRENIFQLSHTPLQNAPMNELLLRGDSKHSLWKLRVGQLDVTIPPSRTAVTALSAQLCPNETILNKPNVEVFLHPRCWILAHRPVQSFSSFPWAFERLDLSTWPTCVKVLPHFASSFFAVPKSTNLR